MVYRFVTANSIEQLILDRAESKRKLEKLVIHKGKFKGKGKERYSAMGSDELRALLTADAADAISFAPGAEVRDIPHFPCFHSRAPLKIHGWTGGCPIWRNR